MRKIISNLLASIAVAVFAVGPAFAAKQTEPLSSVSHIETFSLGPLEAATTTTYVSAADINVSDNSALSIARAAVSWPGRNLIATFTEASGSSLAATVTVVGVDQFGQAISESFSATAGSVTRTGSKIFRSITSVTLTSATSEASGDTFSLGHGNKVGVPRMFSSDRHEIKSAFTVSASASYGARRYIRKVAIPSNVNGATTERSTGYTLPTKCAVNNVWIDVTTAPTAGSTKTLDIGTDSSASGDADGFLDGVSVATTGIKQGTLASGAVTVGALGRIDIDGSSHFAREPAVSSTACGKLVTASAGSNNIADLAGNIFLDVTEFSATAVQHDLPGFAGITVNSTNFDTTYFAVNAAAFPSSVVSDGERLVIMMETDNRTPDNRRSPQR
jgi:hypothetical protein